LSSKGQLTVPIEIRRRYGLDTGDEVEFVSEQKGAYLVPIKRRRLLDLAGSLPATKPWPGMAEARLIAGRKRGAELEKKARAK
jgi:bifunctional DNA-binding transcriptional regulator/antitoxin component of YhaV-PrlF toxin-antitoxin module